MRLDGASDRSVFVERLMSPQLIIIGGVLRQKSGAVAFHVLDAAKRISSTRVKYEPGKKEPRAGGCAGLRAAKGARGSSRAILRRLLHHFDEPVTSSKNGPRVWIFRRAGSLLESNCERDYAVLPSVITFARSAAPCWK
jgi:hypothetical protein